MIPVTRTVTISWLPVADANAYQVIKNDGGVFNEIGMTTGTQISIPGLPEEEFEIAVRANNGLWGPYSELVTVPMSAPAKVTGVVVVDSTPDA